MLLPWGQQVRYPVSVEQVGEEEEEEEEKEKKEKNAEDKSRIKVLFKLRCFAVLRFFQ